MFYIDPYYLILVLPTLIFAMYAQYKVKSTYQRYSQVPCRMGYTGAQAADTILRGAGIFDVGIEHVVGQLSDHYDPRKKMLRLSDSVFDSTSIAALGVAAHEVGHAIQHHEGYLPLKLRNAIIPVTQIASNLSMPLIFFGILFGGVRGNTDFGYFLIQMGILLFGAAVVFQLITLPVEFNASGEPSPYWEAAIYCWRTRFRRRDVFVSGGHDLRGSRGDSPCSLLRLLLLFGRRNGNDR
ncbi:MAG: zinc metallopeptidase [Clostridia bacterium]